MPLDPSIALAYRPPQVNIEVPHPLEQFGQILTLRDLMTRGQLGQLGLQSKQLELDQLRLEAQQRANIAGLIARGMGQTQPSAATQPVQAGAYQEPNLMRPAGPEGRAPVTAAPDQTIPQQTPPFGLTGGPESVPGLPNVGAFPSPPPGASLSAMMTQPQTAPAVTAPTAAAGPALTAAPVEDPFAGLPSTADLIRVGGTTGMAYGENIAKAKKTYYENLEANHKAQAAASNELATIASTVHDEPTKIAAIAEAFARKRITPEVRDQLLSHPYDKQEWDGFQLQALDAEKRFDEARKVINQRALEEQQAHDRAMRPFQEATAAAQATEAGAKAKTATYGSVAQDAGLATDQPSWDTFRAGVPDPLRSKIPATYSPAAQQQTVAILGQTPEQQITTAATAKQHGLQNVFDAIKAKIEGEKNVREEKTYQATFGDQANQALVGVEPKLRSQVSREVSKLNDDYLKAQAAADQFQSVVELAKAGNKAAGSNLPVLGVETMNALNGIKRVPRYQVEQYQGAGSLYDNIMGKIGKLKTGDPIPADVLKDMESMHNLLRQNSDSEYRSKLQSKNDIYHSNFQPVGRSGSGSATVKMKAPDGTVRDIPSDQVDHYKSIGASVVQ